jgi:ABC-type lipopolysaccharide export system ATPase subunit
VSTLEAKQLSTVSSQRKIAAKKFSQSLKGELDWIVMKALEKDRNRRYASASALAADVQRFLNDEPVAACPPSAVYQLKKYAKRHKGLLYTDANLWVSELHEVGRTAADSCFAQLQVVKKTSAVAESL